MKDIQIDEKSLQAHRLNTVQEISKLLETNDRVVCVRYTGYGKTYYVLNGLIKSKPNAIFLILVPTINLVSQYYEIFDSKRVKIATYQSLLNKTGDELISLYGEIEYIVCDECHHLGENVWGDVVNQLTDILSGVKVVGLTATPLRGDSINIIDSFFDGVQVDNMDLLEGIRRKFVPKIKYVVAYYSMDDSLLVDKRVLDTDRYAINKLINVPNILKKYVDEQKLNQNYKIIVYVSRLKDIQPTMQMCHNWFKEAFPNKTVNVFYQNSLQKIWHNTEQLQDFIEQRDETNIDIIVSVDMLSEGVHIPGVSSIIMFRHTKSPVVYFQQIGRTINNSQPLIFDFVNNSNNLRIYRKLYRAYNNQENWTGDYKNKKIVFDNCIELCDETQDIEAILDKYNKQNPQSLYYKSIVEKINSNMCNIIKLIEQGLSIIKISEQLDIDYHILRCYLRDNEIKTKFSRYSESSREKFNLEIDKYIENLKQKYITKSELAKRIGCSVDYLYMYLCNNYPDLVQKQQIQSGLNDVEREYIRLNLCADNYIHILNRFKNRDTTSYIRKYALKIGLEPKKLHLEYQLSLKDKVRKYVANNQLQSINRNELYNILMAEFDISKNFIDTILNELR